MQRDSSQAWSHAGWLAALALAGLLALPYAVFPSQILLGKYRQYDTAWQVDLEGQLADGRISGRDLTFNFGWAYQCAHGLGLVVPPGDMASVIRWYELPATLAVLTALGCLVRLSGAEFRVRALLLVVWLLAVAVPGEFKATAIKPMLPLAPIVAGLYAAAGGWHARPLVRRVFGWGSWLVAPALASNYSFELGLLILAALGAASLVTMGLFGRTNSPESSRLRRGILTGWVLGISGLALFLAPALWSPVWRRYLQESWALSQSYQTAWAFPAGPLELALLALPLVGSGLIGLLLAVQLWRSTPVLGRPDAYGLGLLGAAFYSAAMTRYGITRTDLFHLWAALAPLTFLTAVLLPAYLLSRRTTDPSGKWLPQWLPWALVAVALAPYLPSRTWNQGWQVKLGALARTSLRSAEIRFTDPGIEAACRAAGQLPESELLVWPYGGQINRWAGKRNPCYSILPTEAHNAFLVNGTLRALDRLVDLPVLVFREAIPTDNVTSLTRTSALFGRLVRGWGLAGPPEASFALLRPRAVEETWEETPLLDPGTNPSLTPGAGQAIRLPIDGPRCRASDLVRVRLRASPTSLGGWRKPGFTWLVLTVGPDRQIPRQVPLAMDGQDHDFLVSGLDLSDPLFLWMFADGRGWQCREPVTAVQLGWQPMDPLSRAPAEITLVEAAVLRPAGRDWVETPLTDQTRLGVQRWCWGQTDERPAAGP